MNSSPYRLDYGLRLVSQKTMDIVIAVASIELSTNIHISLLTWNEVTERVASDVLIRSEENIDCGGSVRELRAKGSDSYSDKTCRNIANCNERQNSHHPRVTV